MSAASDLQQTIRSSIPLSEAMQFAIQHLDDRSIRVNAPLQPNINIHGTGFAGSIYGVSILAGWALCQHVINNTGVAAELVVGKAEITYHNPLTGNLDCHCALETAEVQQFTNRLLAGKTARLPLLVNVGDAPAASLQAVFFARPHSPV